MKLIKKTNVGGNVSYYILKGEEKELIGYDRPKSICNDENEAKNMFANAVLNNYPKEEVLLSSEDDNSNTVTIDKATNVIKILNKEGNIIWDSSNIKE